MNENIKKIYIGYLTKYNVQSKLTQVNTIVELDQFFVVDQTVGWQQEIFSILDNFACIETKVMYDWGDDSGKVLKKMDNIKEEKVK